MLPGALPNHEDHLVSLFSRVERPGCSTVGSGPFDKRKWVSREPRVPQGRNSIVYNPYVALQYWRSVNSVSKYVHVLGLFSSPASPRS